jgi:putative endonuclease
MFYVYVLQSKKDGKLYTGFTEDLKRRLKEHEKGEVRATKYRAPFELMYYEACHNKYDALRKEKYMKSTYGSRYLRNRLKAYFAKYSTGRGEE